ncbi:hypothetical protein NQ317_006962 [Molorchus minor]|uniref:Beat protein n=1 Tax=Molorchus minor TaxID=1323400 RepID=A0ABQ9JVN1_9CUCU|nr:hypothetical protein NQ317_006962 [Molorchus minor]
MIRGMSLHLVELRIPSHVIRNQSARLECHFDLDDETLYSVKWYKDGNEFYRYVPRDMPPTQTFPLPGVTVDVPIAIDSNFKKNFEELGAASSHEMSKSDVIPENVKL